MRGAREGAMSKLANKQVEHIVARLAAHGFQISDEQRPQAKLRLDIALTSYYASLMHPKHIIALKHLAEANYAAKALYKHLEAAEEARLKPLPFAIAGHGAPWWLEKIEALIEVTEDLSCYKAKKIKEGPGPLKYLVGVDLADIFEHLTSTCPGYTKIDCEEEHGGHLRDVTKVSGPYIDFCEQVLKEARILTPQGSAYDRGTLARYSTEMRDLRQGDANPLFQF